MKKFVNFFDTHIEKILIIFLLIQPVIDLLTSLMVRFFDADITIGVIVRILMMLILAFYYFSISKFKLYKKTYLYFICLAIYFVIYFINVLVFKDASALFVELKFLFKTFYFPIMLVLLFNVFRHKKIDLKLIYFIIPMLTYGFLIFLANVTNTGFITYSEGRLGSVGWFYAGNEIGTIITILFPILLFYVIDNKSEILNYIVLILYILMGLTIGTKVPALGFIISFLGFIIIYIAKLFMEKEKQTLKILTIPIIALFLFILFIFPYTPSGQNFSMHLSFVHVDSVSDFFDNDEDDDAMNVIYSSRDKYLTSTRNNYFESSFWLKLTGIGVVEYFGEENQNIKFIEMDFHDLFYRFGLFGFIIYFSSFVFVFLKIIKEFFKKFINNIMNLKVLTFCLVCGLALSISYIAGHVMTAPAVSIYLILDLCVLYFLLYDS